MNVLKTINEIEAALCWSLTKPQPLPQRTQKTINHYTRQLERLGCIKFDKAGWNYKQLHFVTYDNYDKDPPAYEKRKRKIKQETLPELPFDPFLSRMMGYTDIPVAQGEIHTLLDRKCPEEALRKMNYGWMGYQSGLEAA